jgi:DNA-binding transcriptional regulator YiaG
MTPVKPARNERRHKEAARADTFATKEAVRAARVAANLTQTEAAKLLGGFAKRTWQAWEAGTRRMRMPLLHRFKQLALGENDAT